MKAKEPALVYTGKVTPAEFKYYVEHSMDTEISNWLNQTFKGGYGVGYYWSHGKIWFRKEKDELLFLLKWA